MSALTDYMEWLNAIQPNTEEISGIYRAIESLTNHSGVTIRSANKGNWIVSYPNAHNNDLLLTEKSREAILKYITRHYCDGLDIETWYGMTLNLEKED